MLTSAEPSDTLSSQSARPVRSAPPRLLYRMLRVLFIGIVGGYLLTCVLLYFEQEHLLFPAGPLPHDFRYPFHTPFEEVFLPVDGATLAAVHFKQPNSKGVVLFLHGNGETLLNAEGRAERFLRNGYDVFALDYRGYGKSTGTIASEASLHQDVRAVYEYLRRTYRDDQMVFYGHSLGTGLVIRLAATVTPRELILEAPFLSLQDTVGQIAPYLPTALLRYPLRSDRWIGAVRCPIYLFHGTDDELIPYNSSERLQTYITAPYQLITIVGARHNNIRTFALYQEQIDRILK
ncbi:MAG: alpha/beta hydrolase [Roseiflexaceae bacterium]